jgi:hypothetical protein
MAALLVPCFQQNSFLAVVAVLQLFLNIHASLLSLLRVS